MSVYNLLLAPVVMVTVPVPKMPSTEPLPILTPDIHFEVPGLKVPLMNSRLIVTHMLSRTRIYQPV